MAISGVPIGYISIMKMQSLVHRAVLSVVDGRAENLALIIGEQARANPQKAISDVIYQHLLKPFGQGKLTLYVQHPATGQTLTLPPFVWVSAKAPSWLLCRPGLHGEAQVIEDYAEFVGREIFADTRQGVMLSATIAATILKQNLISIESDLEAKIREATQKIEAWRKHFEKWDTQIEPTFEFSDDIAQAPDTMKHDPRKNYAKYPIVPMNVALSLLFPETGDLVFYQLANAEKMQDLLFRGDLVACGIFTSPNTIETTYSDITQTDWATLQIYHSGDDTDDLYATADLMPYRTSWQKLQIRTKELAELCAAHDEATLECAEDDPNYDIQSGKARERAKAALIEIYGSPKRPDGISQEAAHVAVNEHLKGAGATKVSITTVLRALGERN